LPGFYVISGPGKIPRVDVGIYAETRLWRMPSRHATKNRLNFAGDNQSILQSILPHETPMPFVYILGCTTLRGPISYVGWTLDIERRLKQHNAGTGARTTRGRAWSLLHSESFETREDAMSREWHLKRDRKFRKELLAGFVAATPQQRPERRVR
jgi:putative endonuclease